MIAATKRIGDWFLTFTGKKFYPIDPDPDDICIEDIVHSLSLTCRFGGHCRMFYSVAQHSVHVSNLCYGFGRDVEFHGLMHDATEAYVGDMVRPLKQSMPQYQGCEYVVWCAICRKFNLPVELHPQVKRADNTALMTERRDICTQSNHRWSLEKDFPPDEKKIVSLDSQAAYALFRNRYDELTS